MQPHTSTAARGGLRRTCAAAVPTHAQGDAALATAVPLELQRPDLRGVQRRPLDGAVADRGVADELAAQQPLVLHLDGEGRRGSAGVGHREVGALADGVLLVAAGGEPPWAAAPRLVAKLEFDVGHQRALLHHPVAQGAHPVHRTVLRGAQRGDAQHLHLQLALHGHNNEHVSSLDALPVVTRYLHHPPVLGDQLPGLSVLVPGDVHLLAIGRGPGRHGAQGHVVARGHLRPPRGRQHLQHEGVAVLRVVALSAPDPAHPVGALLGGIQGELAGLPCRTAGDADGAVRPGGPRPDGAVGHQVVGPHLPPAVARAVVEPPELLGGGGAVEPLALGAVEAHLDGAGQDLHDSVVLALVFEVGARDVDDDAVVEPPLLAVAPDVNALALRVAAGAAGVGLLLRACRRRG
mmetsp:Transcript_134637/g.418419  ORF Transcript_134637/g.418419 Transcript_134637/m.418419 type:complete len:406 (-) Transcript_134637:331-1548(-)